MKDASAITAEPDFCMFFESCVHGSNQGSAIAKFLLNTASKHANDNNTTVAELGITAEQVQGIIELRASNEIGSSAADKLFGLLCTSDQTAKAGKLTFESMFTNGMLADKYYDGSITGTVYKKGDNSWFWDKNNSKDLTNLLAEYSTDVNQSMHELGLKDYNANLKNQKSSQP